MLLDLDRVFAKRKEDTDKESPRDDLVLQASWAFEPARPWAHDWPTV